MGSTKQEPNTVGKPSGFMLENIANTFKLARDEVRAVMHNTQHKICVTHTGIVGAGRSGARESKGEAV